MSCTSGWANLSSLQKKLFLPLARAISTALKLMEDQLAKKNRVREKRRPRRLCPNLSSTDYKGSQYPIWISKGMLFVIPKANVYKSPALDIYIVLQIQIILELSTQFCRRQHQEFISANSCSQIQSSRQKLSYTFKKKHRLMEQLKWQRTCLPTARTQVQILVPPP